jgi:hypothetical protein
MIQCNEMMYQCGEIKSTAQKKVAVVYFKSRFDLRISEYNTGLRTAYCQSNLLVAQGQ